MKNCSKNQAVVVEKRRTERKDLEVHVLCDVLRRTTRKRLQRQEKGSNRSNSIAKKEPHLPFLCFPHSFLSTPGMLLFLETRRRWRTHRETHSRRWLLKERIREKEEKHLQHLKRLSWVKVYGKNCKDKVNGSSLFFPFVLRYSFFPVFCSSFRLPFPFSLLFFLFSCLFFPLLSLSLFFPLFLWHQRKPIVRSAQTTDIQVKRKETPRRLHSRPS